MQYPDFQCVCIAAKDCKAPMTISIQGDKGYLYSNDSAGTYSGFSFVPNFGEPEQFCLNGDKPRMYHELKAMVDMIKSRDTESFRHMGAHTLAVMEILDEARRQINIEGY